MVRGEGAAGVLRDVCGSSDGGLSVLDRSWARFRAWKRNGLGKMFSRAGYGSNASNSVTGRTRGGSTGAGIEGRAKAQRRRVRGGGSNLVGSSSRISLPLLNGLDVAKGYTFFNASCVLNFI
jgi:hypothetical protein